MNENRLDDYLDRMRQAATGACSFVEGASKLDFLADKRTQQAVILSLIVIGEASTKIMGQYAEYADQHPEVPWRSMRGMRNRIAHGYFDLNLDMVWDTVQAALPAFWRNCPNNEDRLPQKTNESGGAMRANIKGLADRLELFQAKAAMPLFEEISNAIDAIA